MKKKRIWFWIAQSLWGFPQNLLGAALYALLRKSRREWYRCARVTYWRYGSGLSLGGFLFLPESRPSLLVHEYGHCFQSLLLGPLFFLIVGLPSAVWAGLPMMERLRKRKRIGYYDRFPENWANAFGSRITGKTPPKG